MTKYSKLNVVYRLQKWMDSVPGQTFLNYAYSWGASIVILGTLFKLTHLPGANFFLFLGMGTEVFVFFISAFDRPFDKTTDGMDLDLHVAEEGLSGVVVNGESNLVQGGPTVIGGGSTVIGGEGGSTVIGGEGGGSAIIGGGGGTIVIGGSGGVVSPTASDAQSDEDGLSVRQAQTEGPVVVGGGGGIIGGGAMVAPQQPETLPMGEELKEATSNYIDELNRLTEMLTQVSEQSKRLTRDSEEMENLNRTLTGISRVYEMQLKSASSQIATIDEINEQTRHMAEQIQELNKIYARMIEAMQIRSQM
jgi:archaellum component FlaC